MSLKKTLILACVLCLAAFYLTKFELPKQEQEKNRGLIFKESKASNVSRVEIAKLLPGESNPQKYALINTNPESIAEESGASNSNEPDAAENKKAIEKWRIEGVNDLSLEPAATEALIMSLRDLKLDTALTAEESKSGLKDFGLDTPELKVKIKDAAGKESELSFGALNSYLQKRYVKTSFDDLVYLVPEESFTALNKQKNDFRDKAPIKFEDQNLIEINLQSSKGTITLKQDASNKWTIESPEKLDAGEQAILDLLTATKGVRVAEFYDGAAANLTDYGLDKPKATLKLNFKAESKREPITIIVGSTQAKSGNSESNEIFFALNGSSAVFKAVSDPLPQLMRSVDELRDPTVLSFDPERVVKANFSSLDGKELSLEKNDGKWTVNGKPGDEMFIEQVLTALSSLQASGFSKSDKAGFAKPKVQITLSLKSSDPKGSAETKLLVVGDLAREKPDKMYYARVGDKPAVFLLNEESVKKINAREETLLKIEGAGVNQ